VKATTSGSAPATGEKTVKPTGGQVPSTVVAQGPDVANARAGSAKKALSTRFAAVASTRRSSAVAPARRRRWMVLMPPEARR